MSLAPAFVVYAAPFDCQRLSDKAGDLMQARITDVAELEAGEVYFIPGTGKLVYDSASPDNSELYFYFYDIHAGAHNHSKRSAVIITRDQAIYPADSPAIRRLIAEKVALDYDLQQHARDLLRVYILKGNNLAFLTWLRSKGLNFESLDWTNYSFALDYYKETGNDLLKEALLSFFEREKTSQGVRSGFSLRLPWPEAPTAFGEIRSNSAHTEHIPQRMHQLPFYIDEYLRTQIYQQGIGLLFPGALPTRVNSFSLTDYVPSHFSEHGAHLSTQKIEEFKANPSLEGARALLKPYRERLLQQYSGKVDLIINVPPSSDSLATQFLAKALAEILSVPVADPLRKRHATPQKSQETLMQRLFNAANSIEFVGNRSMQRKSDMRGKRILIVDDIMTSGVTGVEIQRYLHENGVVDTQMFAFAQTRDPDQISESDFESASTRARRQWEQWNQAITQGDLRSFASPDFFKRFLELNGFSSTEGSSLLEKLVLNNLEASVVAILDSPEILESLTQEKRAQWKRLMGEAIQKSPYLQDTLSAEASEVLKN